MITDAQVEVALAADMMERGGVVWNEVLDEAEQEFEKRIMRAALEAAERAAWRPIEEAPKDGRWFMVGAPSDYDVIGNNPWWVGTARFEFPFDNTPELMIASGYDKGPVFATHFRPLPSPPEYKP